MTHHAKTSALGGMSLEVPAGYSFDYGSSTQCIKLDAKHCLALYLPGGPAGYVDILCIINTIGQNIF